jgi:2-oxoisovalerate dehydrogenase E1 component
VGARVVDLRWIAPLPEASIRAHAREARAVLVFDECRRSGNMSEAIATTLLEDGLTAPFARVTSADSFVPLADAANLVLADEAEIVETARALAAKRS